MNFGVLTGQSIKYHRHKINVSYNLHAQLPYSLAVDGHFSVGKLTVVAQLRVMEIPFLILLRKPMQTLLISASNIGLNTFGVLCKTDNTTLTI